MKKFLMFAVALLCLMVAVVFGLLIIGSFNTNDTFEKDALASALDANVSSCIESYDATEDWEYMYQTVQGAKRRGYTKLKAKQLMDKSMDEILESYEPSPMQEMFLSDPASVQRRGAQDIVNAVYAGAPLSEARDTYCNREMKAMLDNLAD